MHTPGTVLLNHGGNLVGFVEKKSGIGLVSRAQTSNLKKLSQAGDGTGDFLVAFLNRSLPLQSFTVDLFLILINQAFIELGGCRIVVAFAFEDRVVGRRVAGAAPHEINVSVSVFILGHDVALGGVVLADLDLNFNHRRGLRVY